jgi:GNAT superfamily N-acetyltransferase
VSGVVIKPVGKDERAAWEPLWKAYQVFYETRLSEENNGVLWERLHDPAEPMFLLGAYAGGNLVGITHFLYHRSCWSIGNYCYLQDLFVVPEARGRGAGRALIEAVYATAKEAGVSRVHWLTQEGNATARALYDKLADRSGFIQYRKLF